MFIIDIHTHTSYGSPCGYMDPVELIRQAKLIGLDGVCITEHDQIWDVKAIERLRKQHQFLVIGGVEVTTDCGEILVFGLRQPVLRVYRAQELRELVEQAGGVMIAAHPFRGEPAIIGSGPPGLSLSVEAASQRPIFQWVEAVEVCNGMAGSRERDFTAQVTHRLKLKHTGGSDAHGILGVGCCFTIFENRIRNEKDLIREIKRGRCRGADWRSGALPNRPGQSRT